MNIIRALFLMFPTISLLYSNVCSENIKVGALLCLTSACADTGHQSLRGIKLAIHDIESRSEDRIELITENSDELNGSAPVTAYQSIRRKFDKAFIIGPSWSVGGLAVAPIVAKDKDVLMMSPSLGVREFKEYGGNLFCIWPHDDVGTRALARRAYGKGQKRFAVIAHLAPWDLTQAKTFKEEIISLGGTVDLYIEYQPTELDLKGYALKIAKSNVDAVYLSNYAQLGLFSRELKKYGFKGARYASYMEKIQLEQAKGSLEGVEFNMQPEASGDFSSAYQKQFNEKPGTAADTAYDAMMLIYKAIKDSKSQEPSVVSSYLLNVKNYQGASGEITFDSQGGITRPPSFFVLRGQTFDRIE